MKGNQGFTLMEMMMVIAIIAIMSAVSIPNIITWRINASLNGDSRTLKADLERARSRAIRDNTNVTVTFNMANNSYIVTNDIGDTLQSRSLNNNIDNTSLAATTFNSRGRSLNSGNVFLSNSGGNKQLSINMIGSIRIN